MVLSKDEIVAWISWIIDGVRHESPITSSVVLFPSTRKRLDKFTYDGSDMQAPFS